MAFSADYRCISQWVSYHGKMTITQIGESTIEVTLADTGGVPIDGSFRGVSVDEALSKANQALPAWLEETKSLLDSLVCGELKATDAEFLCVPGWPPVRNPFYVASYLSIKRDALKRAPYVIC